VISVGIRDLKNNLSKYLARVKQGDEVLITDRGKSVARMIPAISEKNGLRKTLETMAAEGLVTLPTRRLRKGIPDPIPVGGKPASEMVIEDRR
jgi:prevent-host-death family protein